jgi:hypothetical protein
MNIVTLPAETVSGTTEVEKLAHIALSPEFKAAVTSKAYAPAIGEQDLAAVLQRLGEITSQVASGETKDIETMLAAQALTLDSIFHKLAIQAERNVGQYPKAVDTYLRLALKAQSQCRATAETLAAIKSPRQHITQNNVAGAMRINIEMEGSHVDRGAKGKDAASNPAVEALGEVHWAKDGSWEGSIKGKLPETRDVFS